MPNAKHCDNACGWENINWARKTKHSKNGPTNEEKKAHVPPPPATQLTTKKIRNPFLIRSSQLFLQTPNSVQPSWFFGQQRWRTFERNECEHEKNLHKFAGQLGSASLRCKRFWEFFTRQSLTSARTIPGQAHRFLVDVG